MAPSFFLPSLKVFSFAFHNAHHTPIVHLFHPTRLEWIPTPKTNCMKSKHNGFLHRGELNPSQAYQLVWKGNLITISSQYATSLYQHAWPSPAWSPPVYSFSTHCAILFVQSGFLCASSLFVFFKCTPWPYFTTRLLVIFVGLVFRLLASLLGLLLKPCMLNSIVRRTATSSGNRRSYWLQNRMIRSGRPPRRGPTTRSVQSERQTALKGPLTRIERNYKSGTSQ